METKALSILEYDKILTFLAECAVSESGKVVCREAKPFSDHRSVQRALDETQSADDAWARCSGNPMEAFYECSEYLSRCAGGAVPSPAWLLQIAYTLRAVRTVKARLLDNETTGPVRKMAVSLMPDKNLEDEINRCVKSDDDLYDGASAELGNIRRKMRNAVDKVRSRLQDIISSSHYANMLQDSIITQRNGRYVVPVKAEYAREMKGLEHDRSQTGATVFIEPLSVLEANNELRNLQAQERNEIERILLALGGMVGERKADIEQGTRLLQQLDFAFAKASLARKQRAVMPELSEYDEVELQAARHPLIAPDDVVPIDITLGGDTRALIVTGPNTGGKTVTLKTAGLFTLMAQTGLFLPCEKARVGVFSSVMADIGDEQSIEQSLSTFSSHMVHIVDIVEQAQTGVLVLMDELGAGTDPVEGAALAIAVLEEITGRGALAIATTHYSELKSFAMTTPGFLNAGMEFDVETLSPTYRLMVGYAGSSNAFEISRRLGLPKRIIDSAKGHVSEEAAQFEAALAKADSLRLKAQNELERMKFERERNVREMDQQRLLAAKELDEERKLAAETLQRANTELEHAREVAREAIERAQLAARQENAAERDRALQKARDSLRALPDKAGMAGETGSTMEVPDKLSPGDTVYVQTLSTEATVLSEPDDRGEVALQAGIMKVNAKVEDLRVVRRASKAKPKQVHVRRSGGARPAKSEVDVRGMTVYEAQLAIDVQMDSAVMAGLNILWIIHGKGTGALRTGVRSYLKKHPHVKSFRSGVYGEGEDGVTIVELK